MAECISGNCQNGYGTYSYFNGEQYIGEWKNHKYDGQGTFIGVDGQKYVGRWKNNKKNGQGTTSWPDGRIAIIQWENGKRKKNSSIVITFPLNEIETTKINNNNKVRTQKVNNKILIHSSKQEIKREKKKTSHFEKIKGYLENDLIISKKDYDDVLDKGTYMEFNMKNKTIIIPQGYENITLKKLPKLSVPVDKRKITITPTVIKTIRDKKIIGFKIETNIKLENIKCDDKELVLTTKTNYIYISKPRAVRAKYSLKLITKKGAVLVYDCDENSCHSRKKDEL